MQRQDFLNPLTSFTLTYIEKKDKSQVKLGVYVGVKRTVVQGLRFQRGVQTENRLDAASGGGLGAREWHRGMEIDTQ